MTLAAAVVCAALLGSIGGQVTDADTGAPIAGARITIAGPEVATASAMVLTDSEGRFRSGGLTPGRYELSVVARGYVTAFGTWRASFTVDAAATVQEAAFRLHRGAVLAGIISDDTGEPIANLQVEAIRVPDPLARTTRLIAQQTAITDDRGYYRFWGLRAGRYVVAARPAVADIAAGRVDGVPSSSFYPGVQAPSLAEMITVASAADIDSINFSVQSGRLAKLSVRVVDSIDHAVPGASVSITPAGAGVSPVLNAFPAGPGLFVSPQMPPGDYVILAVSGRAGSSVSYAVQPVTIAGDGIEVSVVLTPTPAARLTGRVDPAPDASPWPQASIAVSSAAVGEDAARFALAPGAVNPFVGTVQRDGRFSAAVVPGARTIRVTGLPHGWAVLSIALNRREVVDREVAFSPGDPALVRIVVTDRLGTITGKVNEAGATAVIFSVDRTQWTPGTQAIVQAATDQHGHFRIAGVRPGEYLAAAVPREWSEQLRDPEVLEALAHTAVTLTVRAGDSQALALTVRP